MRTMLYSPDSYGLGHVRRSLSVSGALLDAIPGASSRLLTGAPRAHYFDYPPGSDYVKLPTVTKDDSGHYIGTDDDLSLAETVHLRGRLIRQAVHRFGPRVMIVDHSPLGLCGEVLPTLQRLRPTGNGTLRVLGMRDVIDEPEAVLATWKKDRVIDVLRSCYDLILVYGQREIFDPVREYDVPPEVADKTQFVGYIPREARTVDPRGVKEAFAPRTGKLVVLTLGGGGDGDFLLHLFCEAYARLGEHPPFEAVAITGPLMGARERDRFRERAESLPGLTLREYCPDLPQMFEAADFVVSMGGYNTITELACAGARALIVPRTYPRKEQLVRARLLAERGVVGCLAPDRATPQALLHEIVAGMKQPHPPRGWGLRFTGLEKTAVAIKQLVADVAEVA